MTDTTKPAQAIEAQADALQRQAYRQPVLVKLGSIRDLTMSRGSFAADGKTSKGSSTSRGGDFEACGAA